MITLNQSSGNNNDTIWVLKINTDTPIYISTRDLTLDSTFDGQVLNEENYLTPVYYNSSIKEGGGTGSVISYSFSVSRYVSNSAFNGFHNEFYPASGGVYLSSRLVQIGVCWTGATSDSEITWLMTGRIIDYNYEQRRLNVVVFQESEITNKEIPYYSIQKDFDNEVSYFENADKEIYGDVIPIIYGSFNIWQPVPNHEDIFPNVFQSVNFALAPVIITNQATLEMVVCSHKVYTDNYNPSTYFGAGKNNTFKYLGGLDTYMHIYEAAAVSASSINTFSRFKYSLLYTKVKMYGRLHIHLTQASDLTGSTDVTNAIDDDPQTYTAIDEFAVTATDQVALVAKGSDSTSEVGYLGQTPGDIRGTFAIVSNDGSSRNYRIGIRNASDTTALYKETPTSSISGTTIEHKYLDISSDVTAKSDPSLPYTIEELCGYDWYIVNYSAGAGDQIYVYYGYISISNINVVGQIFKNKGFGSIKTPNIRGINIKFSIPGLHT